MTGNVPRIAKSAVTMLIATTAFESVRMGASVFRGLIDLPAREKIGSVAFADFSRATDLSPAGFTFYATFGIGGLLLTGATWIVAARTRAPLYVRRLAAISTVCSLLILAFTTQAAPLMIRLGSSPNDPSLLSQLLDDFAVWTYPRFVCATVSYAAMLSALARLAWPTPDSMHRGPIR